MSSRLKKRQAKKTASWPLWLALAGMVILAAGVALAVKGGSKSAPGVTGAPALAVDQQRIDYGEVKLGSVITTRVQVTNVGDQPLRFTDNPYVELVEGC
jgi:hypothetical protein